MRLGFISQNVGGRRHVYYELKGERPEESWTKFWKVSHPKGFMFFGRVCHRGVTKLRFIEPGVKINSAYYVENCLKPVPGGSLYPREKHKVVSHQNFASADPSKLTQEYLKTVPCRFIPAEHWMGNSSDLARMDFCVNGIFKWALFDKPTDTMLGLKRVMTSVWSKLCQETIDSALESWQDRVSLMIKRRGRHIEHRLSGGKFFDDVEE